MLHIGLKFHILFSMADIYLDLSHWLTRWWRWAQVSVKAPWPQLVCISRNPCLSAFGNLRILTHPNTSFWLLCSTQPLSWFSLSVFHSVLLSLCLGFCCHARCSGNILQVSWCSSNLSFVFISTKTIQTPFSDWLSSSLLPSWLSPRRVYVVLLLLRKGLLLPQSFGRPLWCHHCCRETGLISWIHLHRHRFCLPPQHQMHLIKSLRTWSFWMRQPKCLQTRPWDYVSSSRSNPSSRPKWCFCPQIDFSISNSSQQYCKNSFQN